MSTFTDHTWRTTVAKATIDGRSFRVVRPARPVTDASLHEDRHGAQLSVDKSFARDLAANWKVLRARTSAGGSPHAVELPESSLPAATHDDHAAMRYRDRLDRLHWTVATDTLFITGSRDAFALEASQLRSLVEDSPAFLVERPQGHFCAEINLGNWKFKQHDRSPNAVLHIQICETHR